MNRILLLLLLSALLIPAGCGGGLVADIPTEFDSLINDGWLKYNQGKFDDAYRYFTKAVEAFPQKPEGYIGSGWTLLRRQHPDSASVVFKLGFGYITSAADSVDALSGLAGSYLASGNNNKAAGVAKEYPVKDIDKGFPLKKHDFLLEPGHIEIVQSMAFYRLGQFSAKEKADPDNSVYHLNRTLAIPYTYGTPQELMEKIVEYLDRTKGETVL